ncbi:MAG TPA: hypothetical protein VKP30_02055 [Polyangiaceae bacterium]|nr:hypothetical protein [Polyangiaceae bacterium]
MKAMTKLLLPEDVAVAPVADLPAALNHRDRCSSLVGASMINTRLKSFTRRKGGATGSAVLMSVRRDTVR